MTFLSQTTIVQFLLTTVWASLLNIYFVSITIISGRAPFGDWWKSSDCNTTGWQDDLDRLLEAYTDIPVGTSPIVDLIDGARGPPKGEPPHIKPWYSWPWRLIQGEDSLDLAMAVPIVYPQNITVFQTDDR